MQAWKKQREVKAEYFFKLIHIPTIPNQRRETISLNESESVHGNDCAIFYGVIFFELQLLKRF